MSRYRIMSALYLRTSSITHPPHSASHSLALLLSHSQFCFLCSLRVVSLGLCLCGGLFGSLPLWRSLWVFASVVSLAVSFRVSLAVSLPVSLAVSCWHSCAHKGFRASLCVLLRGLRLLLRGLISRFSLFPLFFVTVFLHFFMNGGV